jgi:hypothetical protein
VLHPLRFPRAYRILPTQFVEDDPCTTRRRSRFSDGSHGVLYAALNFETAFIEVLVRDRFVQRDARFIAFEEIRARSCVQLEIIGHHPLRVVDLRGDGCVRLGAPTDAVRARNQSAGRALGRELYAYPDIEGILFESRLTAGDNIALFDHAVGRVAITHVCELQHHPELASVLETQHISLLP